MADFRPAVAALFAALRGLTGGIELSAAAVNQGLARPT
jgi:hypothetical protein